MSWPNLHDYSTWYRTPYRPAPWVGWLSKVVMVRTSEPLRATSDSHPRPQYVRRSPRYRHRQHLHYFGRYFFKLDQGGRGVCGFSVYSGAPGGEREGERKEEGAGRSKRYAGREWTSGGRMTATVGKSMEMRGKKKKRVSDWPWSR